MNRLHFLDGIRGWGAISVVLYHLFCDGLPVTENSGELLRRILPFSGALAVAAFFLVSGFSLSFRYLETGDGRAWFKLLVGRYVRLVIPIFAICLFVHIALNAGLLAAPTERSAKFAGALPFDPTFEHLLRFAFLDVFVSFSMLETYAGPLFTMGLELAGSVLVLIAVLIFRPLPHRLTWLAISAVGSVIVLRFQPPSPLLPLGSLFFIGATMAEAYRRGYAERAAPWIGWAAILASFVLVWFVTPVDATWWPLVASVYVVGCAVAKPVRSFMSNRVSQYLGKISFPLYLVHGPIMLFVGEPMTRAFGQTVPDRLAINLGACALSFAAAFAFRPINEAAIAAAHWVGSRCSELVERAAARHVEQG